MLSQKKLCNNSAQNETHKTLKMLKVSKEEILLIFFYFRGEVRSPAMLFCMSCKAGRLVFPHHSVRAVKWSTALSLGLFLSATLNIFTQCPCRVSLSVKPSPRTHTLTHTHTSGPMGAAGFFCLSVKLLLHSHERTHTLHTSHQSRLEVGLNVLVVTWFIKSFSCVIHLLGCKSFRSAKYTCVYSCIQFNKS